MKRKLKVNLLYTGSIVLAVSAVGTAGNIEHAANGWGMLAWFWVSIGLMVVALVVAGLGAAAEQKEDKKIHRKPKGTVEPKTSRRKGA